LTSKIFTLRDKLRYLDLIVKVMTLKNFWNILVAARYSLKSY